MKYVNRINLTDHVLLTRLELARQKIGDETASRTTRRLLEAQLDALGIERFPPTDAALPPVVSMRGRARGLEKLPQTTPAAAPAIGSVVSKKGGRRGH